jgi:GNAT superfamily N-acetyltransferase
MISFRTMHEDDIPAGLELCRQAGWNQLAPDWKFFLTSDLESSQVALIDQEIRGTVATIRYGHSFSWISMVLVDPVSRGLGIGTLLLEQALQILQQEETIKLDATPAGREVYLKRGFQDEYPLKRMVNSFVATRPYNSCAKPIQKRDMARIKIFDQNNFGADRGALLDWLYRRMPELGYYVEIGNEIAGYCLGREGHHFIQAGPLMAAHVEAAIELAKAILIRCSGMPVGIDINPSNEKWKDWLEEQGFAVQRSFTRMFKGKNTSPGIPSGQFAITGPEFG